MTGNLTISKALYPQVILNATDPVKRLLIQQSDTGASLYTYTTAGDASNYRGLTLQDAGNQTSVANALRVIDRVDGVTTYYSVLTSANAASQIQALLQGGSISVVKSVQRGTYHYVTDNTTYDGEENGFAYKNITITAVNTNKAFLLVNSAGGGEGNNPYESNGRIVSSTQIRVYQTNSYKSRFFDNINWQVVEFY